MPETARIARSLSALVGLGLERVNDSPVATDTIRLDRKTHKVTSTTPAMGTLVSVSAIARSPDRAEEAIGRAFEEMHQLVGVFSRFDGSSAVTSLNAGGRLGGAPREFFNVVSQALRYHELSRGAFDITVEPVVDLFREHLGADRPREPSPAEITDALALVGSEHIDISDGWISFKRSGMGITLDGIAKGYIVDAIAHTLIRHQIGNYLINAGGDIRTAGTREKGEPWTVAVQDPAKSGLFPDIIHLRDAAVATSGSYEIFFDRDKLFHHIVNSKSGRSPVVNASASVIAPSAMAADALATSVFVLDPRQGVALIDSMPGCECLIVDNHGLQLKSAGWHSATPNTGEEADL